MTGYEPRREPPVPSSRYDLPGIVLAILWFLFELPFMTGWFLREKWRSVRASRRRFSTSIAFAMQNAYLIAKDDQLPRYKRQRAVATMRNCRNLVERLCLQDVDVIDRQLTRLDELEEEGWA